MWEELARDALTLDDTVTVGGRRDTVGRHLVASCLPPSLRPSRDFVKASINHVLEAVNRTHGAEVTARCAEALEALGQWVFARAAMSLCLDDLAPSAEHEAMVREALARIVELRQRYEDGEITDSERSNKAIDLWAEAGDRDGRAVLRATPRDGALFGLTQENGAKIRALRGSIRLLALPSGESAEYPLLHACAAGRSPHEAFLRWRMERHAAFAEDHAPAAIGSLLHDLAVALDGTQVSGLDCGTAQGIVIGPQMSESGEVLRSLGGRAEGRVLAADAVTLGGDVLARRDERVTPALARRLDAAALPAVSVRDPLVCEGDTGPCSRCLGLDPHDGTWPQPADALGPRIAHTIARAVRERPAHMFHIGC
jgi:DNA-directed RNA polymerase subunit beta'